MRDETIACPKCVREFLPVPEDELPPADGVSAIPPTSPGAATNPEPADDEDRPIKEPIDLPLAFALSSWILFGLAVLSAQFPYGRFLAVVMVPLGAVMAGLSLFGLEKRRLLAWSGAAVNAVVFILLLAAPAWIGSPTWLPPVDPNADQTTVLAISKDGRMPVPADWVDAGQAGWQQEDVRVEVASVRVVLLDPKAKSADDRKLRGVQIQLVVTNSGVARALECFPTTETPAIPTLNAPTGKAFVLKRSEGVSKPLTLFPGKTAELTLLFEGTPEASVDLRLELPAAWLATRDPIRFRIPAPMIVRR